MEQSPQQFSFWVEPDPTPAPAEREPIAEEKADAKRIEAEKRRLERERTGAQTDFPFLLKRHSLLMLKGRLRRLRVIPDEILQSPLLMNNALGDLSQIVWNEQLKDLVAGHALIRSLRKNGIRIWERRQRDRGVVLVSRGKRKGLPCLDEKGEEVRIRIVKWDAERHRVAQVVAAGPILFALSKLAGTEARLTAHDDLSGREEEVRSLGDLTGLVYNDELQALVCGHEKVEALRARGLRWWKRLSSRAGVVVDQAGAPVLDEAGQQIGIRIVWWLESRHRLAQLVATGQHTMGFLRSLVKIALPGPTKDDFLGEKFDPREFGDLSGIVWNARRGELVHGHRMVERLIEGGLRRFRRVSSQVARVVGKRGGPVFDAETGEEVSIRIVDWDDRKHRHARLLANYPSFALEDGPLILKRSMHPGKVTSAEVERWVRLERGWDKGRPPTLPDGSIDREVCRTGPRPCPFVACKHHLYLIRQKRAGVVTLSFPDLAPDQMDQMKDTCDLDVAERVKASGKLMTLEAVGERLGITLERARQLEASAMAKIKGLGQELDGDAQDDNDDPSSEADLDVVDDSLSE